IMALVWLPETVHRAQAGGGNPLRYLPELLHRPEVRRILSIDFTYWFSLAMFQTTFALFAARRFGFDAARTGYYFAAFGVLGAVIQGGFIRPIVHRLGDKSTFRVGLVVGAAGLVLSAFTHSAWMFALLLVPVSFGMGLGMPTVSSLVSHSARANEQGRVQGTASAVESLSRTVGPVWGTAVLQRFGDSAPYVSAAAFMTLTLLMTLGYTVTGEGVGAATIGRWIENVAPRPRSLSTITCPPLCLMIP